MGNEAKCVARIDGKKAEGKALLETGELIFRGAECRVKIVFADIRSVTAADGELRIKSKDGAFAFAVGAAAEKWRDKILYPKTRVEKLGVKAGLRVAVVGDVEKDFAKELRQSKAKIVADGAAGTEAVFLFVERNGDAGNIAKAARKIKGAMGLWVVYPKGKKEITEGDVLGAGRKAGLKDVKVVGFSATHTALKFVVPVEKR
ncbi:MAG TPA: hypothetical protein VFN20_04100 [Candidatus Acidoferrum sp.]|nr:hypothetical protein [Candidatus Acidoferrum sp.]